MFRPLVLTSALLLAPVNVALGQPMDSIWVPSEAINLNRKLNDNEVVVCLNKASALVELDRQVAQAVGDALLLNVRFEELVSPFEPYKYDFRIPFSSVDLYVQVTNKCQALMGVRLSPGQMPEWMTVSAPYYRSQVVLASTDAAVDAFATIGAGTDIGSRLGAPGDTQLTSYLRALPEGSRPRRVPYPNNEVLLERLADGTISTAFIWEPALYLVSDGDLDALSVTSVFAAPFAATPVEFAVAFPVSDSYMRGLFDEALSTLIADGVVDDIIDSFSIPPSLVP